MPKRSDDHLISLPETKEIRNKAERAELDALLREAMTLRGLEARMKQVKARITELVQLHNLEAVRSDQNCVFVRYQEGRESLDRKLLVENGVTPEQIFASMKRGDPFIVVEFARIGE